MQTHYDHQVGRFEAPRLPEDRDLLIARARRARAEAMTEVFGTLYAGLRSVARSVVGFVRCAGRGAALMPPRSDFHNRTPARLTGACN
jgi:hypothetical protein